MSTFLHRCSAEKRLKKLVYAVAVCSKNAIATESPHKHSVLVRAFLRCMDYAMRCRVAGICSR